MSTATPYVIHSTDRTIVAERNGADGRRYAVERAQTSRRHANGQPAGPDDVAWRVVVDLGDGQWRVAARSRARNTRASCLAELERLASLPAR